MVQVGGLMQKPLLACPLPLRPLLIYSIPLLQTPTLVLAHARALAQALARAQIQTQTSNFKLKVDRPRLRYSLFGLG